MQVKIIHGKYASMERDINEFLEKIGREPGVKIDIKDIKLNSDSTMDTGIAMIIYNKLSSIKPTES